MERYAGVDWASDKHDVLVQDAAGGEVLATTFTHDERGLRALCGTLVRLGVELVAIERPDGLLIERMLDAGLRVMAIHPNQVAAARPRFRASGGKSDRFDAFVLCELARTDSHRFRVLVADSDDTKALRALSRAREDLVRARVELANQLRAELERFWPGAIDDLSRDRQSDRRWRSWRATPAQWTPTPSARSDSPRSWRATPTADASSPASCSPSSAARARTRRRSRDRGAPRDRAGTCRRAQADCREDRRARPARSLTASARTPTATIFLSLFRDPNSVVCAAALLAEIGDCRARYRSAEALAADAGMSPVAVESGKRKVACFRHGCDHRLRAAICTLADATRHWHPWAQDRYATARARGQDHQRAIRTLGRAWIRVIWRCWQECAAYDPARHRGLQEHVADILD